MLVFCSPLPLQAGINLIEEFHLVVRKKKKIIYEDSQTVKQATQRGCTAWDFQVQTEETPEQPGLTPQPTLLEPEI